MSPVRTCLVLGTLLTAGGAMAAEHPMKMLFPGTDTCYARTYTPQHLASHPKQRIMSVQLVHPFVFAFAENDFRLGLRYRLKKKGAYGPISVYCDAVADGAAACSIEGDMGRFRLSRGQGDTIVMTVERIENEDHSDLAIGGDDKVIVLHKAPMKACPKNTPDE